MKKGISLVSLIIVIIVMIILAGIIIFTGFDSTENATINTFAIELLNIQTAVDDYRYRYEKYPVINEYILNTTTISSESLAQFSDETITDNKITFKILDLSLIGITDTEFGKGEGNDFYILSEATGKVYYLKGVEYKGVTYYTLTTELRKNLDIKTNSTVYKNDIKVYDVIFSPSETDYTNIPVTVQVKLPMTATITSVVVPEGKSISAETTSGMYKIVVVNETTADKTGNYKITVNYQYEGLAKTAEYAVTNFDNIAPTLSVTEKESDDIKTISINATDAGSGIGKIKYEEQEVDDSTYFVNYGKELDGTQITLNIKNAYTIYVEDKAGNYSTVVEIGESAVPAAWRANVTTLYNKVPIPKGFVASHATGENIRAGGLVIYQGVEEVTDENVEEARRSRNQYVWVPVPDFSKFKRKAFNGTITNKIGSGYWEVELDETSNMPLDEQSDMTYMSPETLAEAKAMYASVKKYGGFYMARYEAGIDTRRMNNFEIITGDKVYSQMGKLPYMWITVSNPDEWAYDLGGAIEVCRGLYPKTNNNYGVVSTLVYGVQWDTTLQWFLDTKVVDGAADTRIYGNYKTVSVLKGELNAGARYAIVTTGMTQFYDVEYEDDISITTKDTETTWRLSTGALKKSKLNNIYDMAGNTAEYDMENRYSQEMR